MRFLLLLGLLAPAYAQDPFGAYERSLDERLSAMMAKQEVRPAEPAEARPQTLSANAGRPFPYRGTVERILEAEGLPAELAAVVLVESGGNPYALSPKQARGLWQFIPSTARQYGLRVDAGRDERVEVERATRAAARYLRDLYSRFGNWPLALAAYNAGQNAVTRAMSGARAAAFEAIAPLLPGETRRYVPAVLAAMRLMNSASAPPATAGRLYAIAAPTD